MDPENPTFPTPPPQATTPTVSPVFPKRNNFLIILLCVLLLITLLATGYLFLQVQSLTKQLAQIQIQPTPSSTTTPNPGTETQTENPNAPVVSPYIDVLVNKVEIRYLKTIPVQVELVIGGTLPDQCKYSFYSIENRKDMSVKISLSGIHPPDTCLQTTQNTEYILRLGRDMPESERGFAPGNYKLTVNNYLTTFSIK